MRQVETSKFRATTNTHCGEETHEFIIERMYTEPLHEENEHISTAESVCINGVCDRSSTFNNTDKQIFQEAYIKQEAIEVTRATSINVSAKESFYNSS